MRAFNKSRKSGCLQTDIKSKQFRGSGLLCYLKGEYSGRVYAWLRVQLPSFFTSNSLVQIYYKYNSEH